MSMETDESLKLDSLILGEIQVLLAEKRTSLSALRTGIAIGPERAHRDLALLQHRESDASAGAAAAPELWSGRARLLADLPFDPPHSSLRAPHSRAQPEISVNRGVYRVAPTNLCSNPQLHRGDITSSHQ